MELPSSLDWANTVTMTVGFSEPLGLLQSEHIGLFWHRIRKDYPKVEQILPDPRSLSPSRVLASMSRGQFPLPGFNFSAFDGSSNLLVQQGSLLVSWHRDPGGTTDFDSFFVPAFRNAYNLFEGFAREELSVSGISTDLCELTFSGGFEFPVDLLEVNLGHGLMGAFQAPDIGVPLTRSPELGFTYYYNLESGLHIQVDGEMEHVDDSNYARSAFSLVLEGSQRLGQASKSEVEAWLNSAQGAILECYLRLNA